MKRNTIQNVLIGVLVIGLAWLLLSNVKEGFATETLEIFHKIPVCLPLPRQPTPQQRQDNKTCGAELISAKSKVITAQQIRAKKGKKLQSIAFQRFDKTAQKYVDISPGGQSTNQGANRFNVNGGGKTGLLNDNVVLKRALADTQAQLPLPVSSPVFNSGITISPLEGNALGIRPDTYALDANNFNLKIILTFTD